MKIKLLPLAIALGITTLSGQAIAWEGDIRHDDNRAYAKDTDGDIVRDSWGRCVRTIDWKKDLAIAKCEGWPEPAPVVAAPAPVAAPTPAPAPEPTPVAIVAAPAPAAEAPIAVATPLAFSGFFETNGNNLTQAAQAKLDKYVDYLNAHPTEGVVVTGFTDDRGAASYNQKLSEKRAKAVQTYLESKGISANRITAKGMGESNPVADNATADGRAQNRRVELEITQ